MNANRTLVANFTLQSFTITATVEPVETATVSGAGTYSYGETVTLGFERNEDYAFQNWTENGVVVCEEPDYTFVVTADRDLVAQFLYTEGIGEQNGTEFVLYPNPTSDMLVIENQDCHFGFEVYTMTGELLVSQSNCKGRTEINVAGFSAGLYFVRLTSDNDAVTRIFMKK